MSRIVRRIIIPTAVIALLAAVFFLDGGKTDSTVPAEKIEAVTETTVETVTEAVQSAEVKTADTEPIEAAEAVETVKTVDSIEIIGQTEQIEQHEQIGQAVQAEQTVQTAPTEYAPTTEEQTEEQAEPVPVSETASEEITEEAADTVTVSVSCATVLDNMEQLEPEKAELIPADGWILAPVETEPVEGETAFELTRRICREYGIQLEFSTAPLYNTAYIEGIGNIYEFDCGELSGWEISVNGEFLTSGCSDYTVQSGDVLRWQYTCTMGDIEG